jgi:hypothetical protein
MSLLVTPVYHTGSSAPVVSRLTFAQGSGMSFLEMARGQIEAEKRGEQLYQDLPMGYYAELDGPDTSVVSYAAEGISIYFVQRENQLRAIYLRCPENCAHIRLLLRACGAEDTWNPACEDYKFTESEMIRGVTQFLYRAHDFPKLSRQEDDKNIADLTANIRIQQRFLEEKMAEARVKAQIRAALKGPADPVIPHR